MRDDAGTEAIRIGVAGNRDVQRMLRFSPRVMLKSADTREPTPCPHGGEDRVGGAGQGVPSDAHPQDAAVVQAHVEPVRIHSHREQLPSRRDAPALPEGDLAIQVASHVSTMRRAGPHVGAFAKPGERALPAGAAEDR